MKISLPVKHYKEGGQGGKDGKDSGKNGGKDGKSSGEEGKDGVKKGGKSGGKNGKGSGEDGGKKGKGGGKDGKKKSAKKKGGGKKTTLPEGAGSPMQFVRHFCLVPTLQHQGIVENRLISILNLLPTGSYNIKADHPKRGLLGYFGEFWANPGRKSRNLFCCT